MLFNVSPIINREKYSMKLKIVEFSANIGD